MEAFNCMSLFVLAEANTEGGCTRRKLLVKHLTLTRNVTPERAPYTPNFSGGSSGFPPAFMTAGSLRTTSTLLRTSGHMAHPWCRKQLGDYAMKQCCKDLCYVSQPYRVPRFTQFLATTNVIRNLVSIIGGFQDAQE